MLRLRPLGHLSQFNLNTGAGGLEPPNGGVKVRCLTTWRRPIYKSLYNKNKQGAKMCICINCLYLKNCSVYKFIEEKHEISLNSSSKKSFFTPKQTIIKKQSLRSLQK